MRQLTSLTRFWVQKEFIRKFSNEKPWKEVSIPVPWGYIRGKWWGPTDVRPVLTIHGWQDNCGSFDRLIPLLNKNIGFLAIDLPGHGYSSKLPPGILYHFETYLSTIRFIKNYFQWQKLSLMGHSMGGITCCTYTMVNPDEIDFLVCIDGVKPMSSSLRKSQMTKYFNTFFKHNQFFMDDKEPPSYTMEEMTQKIHAPNKKSVNLDVAHYILERNIAPSKLHPNKYYFTRDPRLKSSSIVPIQQNIVTEIAQNMKCPVFIAKAKDSSYYEAKENFYEILDIFKRTSVDCEYHYVKGTHHVHLNSPETELASLISNFIQKHNVENRSTEKLKEGIIVHENTEIKETNLTESSRNKEL